MSKNVAAIFGKPSRKMVDHPEIHWPLPEQLMGLEIEVENRKEVIHPESYNNFWTKVRDGSLRNGIEYVLRMPLKGDTLSDAIHDMFNGTTFTRSTTGSTHIHLDMLEEDTLHTTIKLLILMMYIFEGVMFAVADRGREWCGYTNKLASAPEVLLGCMLNSTEEDGFADLVTVCRDHYGLGRYYGINVMALDKYGSLEFRYFPTATSVEELTDWVSLVQTFKKAAIEIGTIEQLLSIVESDEAYDRFLTNYFSKWKDTFVQEVPQWQASTSLHKALAISASHLLTHKKPKPVYNVRAVTGNKLLAKFIKVGEQRSYPDLVVSAPNAIAIEASSVGAGTVLLHSGMVYVSTGDDWLGPPYTGYLTRPSAGAKEIALRSLQHHIESIPTLMMNVGHSNSVLISNTMATARRAITELAVRLDEEGYNQNTNHSSPSDIYNLYNASLGEVAVDMEPVQDIEEDEDDLWVEEVDEDSVGGDE